MIGFDKSEIIEMIGSQVERTSLGVGSFFNIFLRDQKSYDRFQIWIYLSDWAITQHGYEKLSSDCDLRGRDNELSAIFSGDVKFQSVIILDEEEVHLIFTNEIVVEIWGNRDVYNGNSELVVFYKNNHTLSQINFK